MKVAWYASETHTEDTVAALRAEGAEVEEELGFEPLTAIVAVMAGAILIQTLIRLYRDARYTGVVIDATREPIEVREMPGWPRRQVLLIRSDEARFFELGDNGTTAEDLSELATLLGNA